LESQPREKRRAARTSSIRADLRLAVTIEAALPDLVKCKPISLAGREKSNSTFKSYKGFPHGMPTTEAETINADLLQFLKKSKQVAA
jgi:hypothetical protein